MFWTQLYNAGGLKPDFLPPLSSGERWKASLPPLLAFELCFRLHFFPPQCHNKPKSQGQLFLCYVFVSMRHSHTGSCPVLIRFSVRSCLTCGSSRNHNIVISIWVLPIYLRFLGWEHDRTHIMEHTMLICSTIKEPCKWIYVHMCIWTHQPHITCSYSSDAIPVLTTLFSSRV